MEAREHWSTALVLPSKERLTQSSRKNLAQKIPQNAGPGKEKRANSGLDGEAKQSKRNIENDKRKN